jgi:hypothetical protein
MQKAGAPRKLALLLARDLDPWIYRGEPLASQAANTSPTQDRRLMSACTIPGWYSCFLTNAATKDQLPYHVGHDLSQTMTTNHRLSLDDETNSDPNRDDLPLGVFGPLQARSAIRSVDFEPNQSLD